MMSWNARTVALVGFVAGALAFGPAKGFADTAYVANEQSVTISVIDTATHTIIQTIGLGADPAIPGTP